MRATLQKNFKKVVGWGEEYRAEFAYFGDCDVKKGFACFDEARFEPCFELFE